MGKYSKAIAATTGSGLGTAIGIVISYAIEALASLDLPDNVENAIAVIAGAIVAGIATYLSPKNLE